MPKIYLKGASGTQYEFEVYPWGTVFNAVGAVYAVLRENPPQQNYFILYIGKTESLKDRFVDHHKQDCFDRNGKTHVGVKVVSTEVERTKIETDLLSNYSTSCNEKIG